MVHSRNLASTGPNGMDRPTMPQCGASCATRLKETETRRDALFLYCTLRSGMSTCSFVAELSQDGTLHGCWWQPPTRMPGYYHRDLCAMNHAAEPLTLTSICSPSARLRTRGFLLMISTRPAAADQHGGGRLSAKQTALNERLAEVGETRWGAVSALSMSGSRLHSKRYELACDDHVTCLVGVAVLRTPTSATRASH
jgi:hypothetical protein